MRASPGYSRPLTLRTAALPGRGVPVGRRRRLRASRSSSSRGSSRRSRNPNELSRFEAIYAVVENGDLRDRRARSRSSGDHEDKPPRRATSTPTRRRAWPSPRFRSIARCDPCSRARARRVGSDLRLDSVLTVTLVSFLALARAPAAPPAIAASARSSSSRSPSALPFLFYGALLLQPRVDGLAPLPGLGADARGARKSLAAARWPSPPPGFSPGGRRSRSTRWRRSACCSRSCGPARFGKPAAPLRSRRRDSARSASSLQRGLLRVALGALLRAGSERGLRAARPRGFLRLRPSEPPHRGAIPRAPHARDSSAVSPSGSGSFRGFLAWWRSREDRTDCVFMLVSIAGFFLLLTGYQTGTAAGALGNRYLLPVLLLRRRSRSSGRSRRRCRVGSSSARPSFSAGSHLLLTFHVAAPSLRCSVAGRQRGRSGSCAAGGSRRASVPAPGWIVSRPGASAVAAAGILRGLGREACRSRPPRSPPAAALLLFLRVRRRVAGAAFQREGVARSRSIARLLGTGSQPRRAGACSGGRDSVERGDEGRDDRSGVAGQSAISKIFQRASQRPPREMAERER